MSCRRDSASLRAAERPARAAGASSPRHGAPRLARRCYRRRDPRDPPLVGRQPRREQAEPRPPHQDPMSRSRARASSEGLANAFVGSLVIVGIATADGAAVRDPRRDLRERVRTAQRSGTAVEPRARRPQRHPGDRHRRSSSTACSSSGAARAGSRARARLPSSCSRSSRARRSRSWRSSRTRYARRRSAWASPRWRTTLGIVVPQAVGGILTGATLAVARVAGETAPLLLLLVDRRTRIQLEPAARAVRACRVAIYELLRLARFRPTTRSPGPARSFCIIFILVTSLTARWLATRSRRKLGEVATR